ncbi:MAG TPA: hypothetical protein VLO11_15305, partial [Luteolibacter sp.]|nr:hypothetical protein [Luteolibacter sp.]
ETRIPRPQRTVLATTRWSLVRRAAAGTAALDEWIGSCWYPLYTWARQQNWSPEDAADAVQEFLGKICNRNLLADADPARGRFRAWLLTGFSNHLSNAARKTSSIKRGGQHNQKHIDLQTLEQIYHHDMAAVVDPAQAYTRAWAITLMDEALLRLEAYFKSRDRSDLFHALLPALESPLPDSSYEESAARLGMTGPALRQAALRFRQRYRRLLLDVAGERLGITCHARLREELRELLGG